MAKLYDVPLLLLKAPITTRTQDQVKAISLPRFLATVVVVGCFIPTLTLLHLKSSSHIIFLKHKKTLVYIKAITHIYLSAVLLLLVGCLFAMSDE